MNSGESLILLLGLFYLEDVNNFLALLLIKEIRLR